MFKSCVGNFLYYSFRSGPKYNYPENDKVDWLIGSVFNTDKFK